MTNRITSLYTLYLLVLAFLFLAGAEFMYRKKGYVPWRPSDLAISVHPGGTFFRRHPSYGYAHLPGEFTVTLASNYSFRVTHLPNSLRITSPTASRQNPDSREEIWIFGCSFTHGWSLNDEDTYPWLLQEKFPAYDVVNFGVSGYGTIHSLLQFTDALTQKKPRVAILAFASFHDARNTFSRTHIKSIAPWNKLGPLMQPFARLDRKGKLRYGFAPVRYKEFPMMRYSAWSHFLEMKYNEYEAGSHRSHEASQALVAEMAKRADENDIQFVLANISGGPAMLNFAKEHHMAHVDISIDLDKAGNRNRPHDQHPSAAANAQYAAKLETYLRDEFPW